MQKSCEDKLNDYITEVEVKSGKTTTKNHKDWLKKMFIDINKPFNKIELQDVLNWLSNHKKKSSSETKKGAIRGIFKKNNRKDIYENIPSNFKVLREPSKGDEAVLSKEEINKLIKAPKNNIMHKALIETHIITGARREAISILRPCDITIDNISVKINIRKPNPNSKVLNRTITCIPYEENPCAINPKNLIHLVELNQDNKISYLFTSQSNNNKGNPFTLSAISKLINKYGKEANIEKNVTPHILRHTSATYDGQFFNEQDLMQKYGWTNSKQARRYCHYNDKMYENNLKKIAGITEEETTQGKKCIKCGEANNIFDEICKRCSTPLNYKDIIKEIDKKDKEINKLLNLTNELKDAEKWKTFYKKKSEELIKVKTNINKKIKDITKDTSDTLDKISKSTKYIFYMSNLDVKIRYNKFITKNPKHTKKQMREYLNKDFLEFQDSKEYQLQLNLLEHLLNII